MIVSAQGISKSFGSKRIIHNFNHAFESGSYALNGKNGAGKSTLLKILSGLDQKFEGTVTYSFDDLNKNRSFLPDKPTTYPFIRGRTFLEYIASIRKNDLLKYSEAANEELELNKILDLKCRAMSLGQIKKLFLVATLIDECPLWILDEPTNGLDQKAVKFLAFRIKQHVKNKGVVIFSEHNECFIKESESQIIAL
ncbi:MAG: ATP-binding cassette domain-containing protein [Oligoflexales bacterium]